MKKVFSRREFLSFGSAVGGFVLGVNAGSALSSSGPEAAAAFPWPYKELNVEATKERAYKDHFKSGCMFGAFESLAGQVGGMLGKPYVDFPFALSSYGGGGVASWGTLCGACNGAAMAVSMFHQGETRSQLIQEVLAWYENTKLPVYVPAEPVRVKKDFAMAASLSESTLCHISITRWSKASGMKSFSPERAERCARLVADVAGYTADLLNNAARGEFAPKLSMSSTAAGCLECHAQGKPTANEPEVVSRMSCTTCHKEYHKKI